VFTPESIVLTEGGPDDPYGWVLTEPLTWRGMFRGSVRELVVPTPPGKPFATDLASVPRSLTWLFPRYGRYSKAAVLHDFLCREFRSPPTEGAAAPTVLPLSDRSDADEVFRLLMQELGVPWLRRWLMWAAVSWTTLIMSFLPGRRDDPMRWVSRIVVALALAAAIAGLVAEFGVITLIAAVVLVLGAVDFGGLLALGRADRVLPYLVVLGVTIVFAPLLAMGVALGVVLYAYLLLEDALGGFPAIRRFLRDLFSKDAKLEKLGTPQFARIAAVIES
jgi:hypothetical protein